MEFISYDLTSEMLCLGERIKKGTFRPTIETIPYSQITGALKAKFGKDKDIHAVGYLIKPLNKDYLVYSPANRVGNLSKIPLIVEYLRDIRGKIYIMKNSDTEDTLKNQEGFTIRMGALKSKGFGECKLFNKQLVNNSKPKPGILNTRIPKECSDRFGIRNVINPVYGYLFKPTSETSGVYVLSLFEGSEVVGPEFLLERGE